MNTAPASGGQTPNAEHQTRSWLASLLTVITTFVTVVSVLAPPPNVLAWLGACLLSCCLAGLAWHIVKRLKRGRAAGILWWLVASVTTAVVLVAALTSAGQGRVVAGARAGSVATTPTTPQPSPGVGLGVGEVSLVNMPVLDEFGGWGREPVVIGGERYDVVLWSDSCISASVKFVLSRGYERFDAGVGIADDSKVADPLDFSVLVDGEVVFTTPAGLGELVPVSVDVRGGTQLTLSIGGFSWCGKTTGVWVAPRLTKAA